MHLEETIAEIRAAHRERCFAMEQRKRADLALLSFLRTQLGWRLDLPEKDRKAIAERAKVIADGGEDADAMRWKSVVEASILARKPFGDIEAASVKVMRDLASKLPAWEAFGKDIRGFGEASLAVVVGEAGDLSIYANPAKLWKRMGLAVMDGVRQGGLKKSSAKDDWIAHGYSPMRRSRMWNIGDALIKSNRDGKYRTLYLERKAFEIERAPEMTPMHAHRRAQRYMEKRLLRNLWQAWRRASVEAHSNVQLSADDFDQEANSAAQPSLAQPPVRNRATVPSNTNQSAPGSASSSQQATVFAPANQGVPAARRRTSRDLKPSVGASAAASSSAEAIAIPQPKKRAPQSRRDETKIDPKPTTRTSRPGTHANSHTR